MPFKFEDCEATYDSGKALKVSIPDLTDNKWVPHSQIHADSEVYRDGDKGCLVITDWLADQWGVS